MIAIVGSIEDDVSFLRQALSNSRTEVGEGNTTFTIGTIGTREVVVTCTGLSQVFSALVTTLLIKRYQPQLVIVVGTCSGINDKKVVQGDLLIAQRILGFQTDYSLLTRSFYGQIPACPPLFLSEDVFVRMWRNLNFTLQKGTLHFGSMLSGDTFYKESKLLSPVMQQYYAKIEDILAYDTDSFAIAATCFRFQVPFIVFKTISHILNHDEQLLTRVRIGLQQSIDMGKMIITVLREMV